jgi:hypothetical protein
MKATVKLVPALLITFSLVHAAFAAHTHLPAHSTWKFNIAKSDFGGGPTIKSDRFTIIIDTDKWLKFTEIEVDSDGREWKTSWSGPQDGTPRPVVGMPGAKASFDTGEDTAHWEFADGSVADVHFDASEDRRIATEHTVLKTKDSKEYHQTWVYDRVD